MSRCLSVSLRADGKEERYRDSAEARDGATPPLTLSLPLSLSLSLSFSGYRDSGPAVLGAQHEPERPPTFGRLVFRVKVLGVGV